MSSNVAKLFGGTTPRNKTLEQLPGRALTLIKGIAKSPEIHHTMETAGYTIETQKQGFALLEAATGFGMVGAPAGASPSTDAITAVSDWYGPSFDRIDAALRHLHPEQAAYVFKGLVSVSGVASVVAAAVFLDRLDDLAGTGPNAAARKATADDDKKALATLAARGFDDKELTRVRVLVDTAHTATADGLAPVTEDEQSKRLDALQAWYDDWSETARALIKKRGDLIKLGLAHPHPHAAAPATPPAPGPVAVPPTPVAPQA